MTIIESKIDTRSEEFTDNSGHMQLQVNDLNERLRDVSHQYAD